VTRAAQLRDKTAPRGTASPNPAANAPASTAERPEHACRQANASATQSVALNAEPTMPAYARAIALLAAFSAPAIAQQAPARTISGQPGEVGDTTRNLLDIQRNGSQAGKMLPLSGEQATLGYARYMRSFSIRCRSSSRRGHRQPAARRRGQPAGERA
jgi:hypothetical protein